jgi:hypothetical protein
VQPGGGKTARWVPNGPRGAEVNLNSRIAKLQPFRNRVGEGLVDPAESIAPALRHAWCNTISLLFRPFHARRWIKLGILCLFLGGGAPSVALNWPLGMLPPDISLSALLERVRVGLANHAWLALPVVLLGLAVGLSLFYVRSLGRFVLVDSILRREVRIRQAWVCNRGLGRSYFGFLVGALVILGSLFALTALALFPYLQSWSSERTAWFPAIVAGLLGSVVLVGALLALGITLTDDFVVPTMYADRAPLLHGWRELLRLMSREPATFGIYILVRIGLSVVSGALVLFLLFPMLLAILSGAMLAKAMGAFALSVLGLVWAWNPGTLALAVAGVGLLSTMLFSALSLAQMPVQIFLQDFGIEFIGSSVPSLAALLKPAADDDQPGDQTLTA